jgi:hypothetical protein
MTTGAAQDFLPSAEGNAGVAPQIRKKTDLSLNRSFSVFVNGLATNAI